MTTNNRVPATIAAIATALAVAVGAYFVTADNPREVVPVIERDLSHIDMGALPAGTYTVDGGEIVVLGAVIRMGKGGPYIHTNDSHANVGIESVGVNSSGDLTIVAPRPSGAQIIAATAAGDETLARLGIMCGVSGGVSSSTVQCYRDGSRVNARSSIYGDFGNIWYTQVMFIPGGTS